MNCGIAMMVLRKRLYGRVEVGNVWDGMKRFGPAFLAFLIVLCIGMATSLVSGGPQIAISIIAPDNQGALMAANLWNMVASAILGALVGGATFFVFPHIAARNVGPVEALQASWEIFRRNWLMFALTAFVYQLIAQLGLVACCVGVLVTAPLAAAAMVHAYIDHFGLQGVNIEE